MQQLALTLFKVEEINEDGHVISRWFFEDHDEATDFAKKMNGFSGNYKGPGGCRHYYTYPRQD